ncbi:hypothetical protein ACHWQZ_G011468 [Mnemiopsis leidyi]
MGKMENIIGQLYSRDSKRPIPYNYRKKLIAKSRNCSYITERCIEVPNTYNKIFASVWVNNDHVVVGTKCNRLLEINVQNGTKREIPLMRSPYPREIPEPAAGIHAIALNPSKSFMATGGHNVNDLALYSLPDYQPYAVGEFHHNWLFGISWINDFMLCTGARDGNICLWTIFDVEGFSTYEESCGIHRKTPIEILKTEGIVRIRDTHYNPVCERLGTVGYGVGKYDAKVCLVDVRQPLQKRVMDLPQKEENIVISGHDTSPVFAVGSLSHLMLIDDRDPNTTDITSVKVLEPAQGIRSLSFQGDVITIGACKTSLMFYDVRNRKYVNDHNDNPVKRCLKQGYVAENWDWHTHRYSFFPQLTSEIISIMTHCYDDSGLRLFAAGGPLPLDLIGNYASIWE